MERIQPIPGDSTKAWRPCWFTTTKQANEKLFVYGTPTWRQYNVTYTIPNFFDYLVIFRVMLAHERKACINRIPSNINIAGSPKDHSNWNSPHIALSTANKATSFQYFLVCLGWKRPNFDTRIDSKEREKTKSDQDLKRYQ